MRIEEIKKYNLENDVLVYETGVWESVPLAGYACSLKDLYTELTPECAANIVKAFSRRTSTHGSTYYDKSLKKHVPKIDDMSF